MVTGTIKNWSFDGNSIVGEIFNDAEKRFADGTQIRTSTVASPEQNIKKGAIVETRNSSYLLGDPAKL